jgi:hypothetical protein
MNYQKFKELILEICDQSIDDDYCGAVKLNKLLFFIDLKSYAKLGRSISGQKYQKLKLGPVPMQILPVLKDMENDGDIQRTNKKVHGYEQQKTIPIRKSNTTVFDEAELMIINETVEYFKKTNGKDISEKSHGFIGWELAQMNEVIPLETIFISTRKLTKKEREYSFKLTGLPEYKELYA